MNMPASGTFSAKRIAKQVVRLFNRYGYEVEVSGFGTSLRGESIYIFCERLDGVTVRVSPHPQPPYGGYSYAKGERYGEADFSIEPVRRTASRGITAASVYSDFPQWMRQTIAAANLPYGWDDLRRDGFAPLGLS